MKHFGIPLKGFRLNKQGKLVRDHKHLDVSTRLKRKASKKIRIGKRIA